MFNSKLKERLLDQELMIIQLREDLKFTCARAADAEAKAKSYEESLTEYAGITEEELELERKLRMAVLQAEIAKTQIDQQKEIAW